MKYKALFIDWDGTLSNSRFWDKWIGTDKYNLIQQTLFSGSNELIQLWMTGYVSYGTVLKYIEDQTNIPYEELRDELEYSARHMQLIDSQVTTLIADLQNSGVKVIIATDNMDTFRHWTVPSLKLDQIFDGILTSDTQGALKSQFEENGRSEFFDTYLNENKLKAHETMLIDNSLDLKVIENIGIDFAHVNGDMSLLKHLTNIVDHINKDIG